MKVLILCLFLACASAQWYPDTTGTTSPYTTTSSRTTKNEEHHRNGFSYNTMTPIGTYFTDRTGHMTTMDGTTPFLYNPTTFNKDATPIPSIYYPNRTGHMNPMDGTTPFMFNPTTFTNSAAPTSTGIITGTIMNTRTKRQILTPATLPLTGVPNLPTPYTSSPYTPTGTPFYPIDNRGAIVGTPSPFPYTPMMTPIGGAIPTIGGPTSIGFKSNMFPFNTYPYGSTYPFGYRGFTGANPYTSGFYPY